MAFELSLSGTYDFAETSRIERELREIDRLDRETTAIVDLRDVGYFDSTLLDALVRTRNRRIAAHGRSDVCIVIPPARFGRRLFDITRLDTAFRIFDDMTAARFYARAAVLLAELRAPTDYR